MEKERPLRTTNPIAGFIEEHPRLTTVYLATLGIIGGAAILVDHINSEGQGVASNPDLRPEMTGDVIPAELTKLKEKTGADIFPGDIIISKGVNVRKQPFIPSGDGPNIVSWKDIIELNGVNIQKSDVFIATNPLIVYKKSPTGPNQAPWLVFEAKVKRLFGGTPKQILYINFGPDTADHVKIVSDGAGRETQVTQVGGIIPQASSVSQR